MAATEMWVCELGEIGYRDALALQERVRDARQQELIPDTLLLLEHNPAVYTRGRRSAPGELSMGEEWYAARGIEIIETNRGGKVTYHGPGQLVGYPIVRVDGRRRVRAPARADARQRARPGRRSPLARATTRVPTTPASGCENRKIASIGVHVARGVTTHGFAINVEARALEPFSWVVACGLPDVADDRDRERARRLRGLGLRLRRARRCFARRRSRTPRRGRRVASELDSGGRRKIVSTLVK